MFAFIFRSMEIRTKNRIKETPNSGLGLNKAVMKMTMTKKTVITVVLLVGLLLSWSVRAENGVAGPVPWVSDIRGGDDSLLIKQKDTDWFEATENTPIGNGDMLWQKPGGHSEVYFDDGSWVRISGNTGVEFAELADGRVRLVQTRGNALVRNGGQGELLVDLPGQTMSLPPRSQAKVKVGEDGYSRVVVKQGKAYVNGPRGRVRVNAGQSLRSDPEGNVINLTRNGSSESLDSYSNTRSRELGSAGGPPTNTVSYLPDPVVYQMSAHGEWVNSPGYGWVWRPRVSAGWAPYRSGRWMHRAGWGWTWISYEPWGWYPYHYGRWVEVNNHWVWAPVRVRSRWHPSLVFWVEGPDYIAWHPIPYGVSVSVVRTWGPSTARRYIRHRGVTVIHHRHFRSCNYHRYVRPWRGVSHRSIRVIHHPHHANHHPISVRYHHTPRTRGYIHKSRAPSSRVVYAHNKRVSRGKSPRVHYGSHRVTSNHGSRHTGSKAVHHRSTNRHGSKNARPDTGRSATPRAGNRADAGRAKGRHYGKSPAAKSRSKSGNRLNTKGDSRRAVNSNPSAHPHKSASRSSAERGIKNGARGKNGHKSHPNRPATGKNRSSRKNPGNNVYGNDRGNYSTPSHTRSKSPSHHRKSYNNSKSSNRSYKSHSSSGKSRHSSHGKRSYSSHSRKSSSSHSHHRSSGSRNSGNSRSKSRHSRNR